jgi:hypothetical protein
MMRLPLSRSGGFCHAFAGVVQRRPMPWIGSCPSFVHKEDARAAGWRFAGILFFISVGEDARNPIVARGAPAISSSLATSHCAGADAGLRDACVDVEYLLMAVAVRRHSLGHLQMRDGE